ncbi:MAG: choice-of-anchor Q domain-containing protein [Thermaceae bacterium]
MVQGTGWSFLGPEASGKCLTTDKHGLNRPQGAACDIGSVERQPKLNNYKP